MPTKETTYTVSECFDHIARCVALETFYIASWDADTRGGWSPNAIAASNLRERLRATANGEGSETKRDVLADLTDALTTPWVRMSGRGAAEHGCALSIEQANEALAIEEANRERDPIVSMFEDGNWADYAREVRGWSDES